MRKNNVVALKKPDTFIDDPLTDLLRQGARTLIAQAVKTELEVFLSHYQELTDPSGRQRLFARA